MIFMSALIRRPVLLAKEYRMERNIFLFEKASSFNLSLIESSFEDRFAFYYSALYRVSIHDIPRLVNQCFSSQEI